MLVSGLLLGSLAIYAASYQQTASLATGIQLDSGIRSQQRSDELQGLMQVMDARLQQNEQDYEASLVKALLQFNQGSLKQAIAELDELTQLAPDFHLAHLVKGDMLMSRFGGISDVGQSPLLQGLTEKEQAMLKRLRDEAHARLRALNSTDLSNKVPLQLLALGNSIDKAFVVEKATNRLFVYQRAETGAPPQLVHDYYVSTGKNPGNKMLSGDLRTPEGVYFVTSWIPDEKLPDKYGIGAFPVNYPNEYDLHLGKTGYGIWLHGTDSGFYSRPPLDSEGCVVLPNIDLQALKQEIVPGVTPVVITEQVDWLELDEWSRQREAILTVLEQWRQDWESLDVERYLSHYADDFWGRGYDIASWKARKRHLAKTKTYQRVTLSDISLFTYPLLSEKGQAIVVARFQQQYDSNNYSGDVSKRIYLRKDQDQWRILYEGS